MKKSKGFTLVELVIVIAVIAILAGVMIGVFAGVVKSAKESARLQELKNQEIAQKAEDILAKVDNANWLGWEDFETKLATTVQESVRNANETTMASDDLKGYISNAVDAAIAKYASSIGTGNTGLTEEQVKFIVENAVASKSSLTETQVKAIVNSAVAGLGTSTITKSQVQSIVENVVTAAQAKNLTAAQVTSIVRELLTTNNANIDTLVKAAVQKYADAALTTSDIETLLAKYISGGSLKGDYTWYDASATTMTIDTSSNDKAAAQIVALSTIAKGGTSFAGQTVTISANIDLTTSASAADFDPIIDFDGTINGKIDEDTNAIITVDVDPVWNSAEGRNGKTMMTYFQSGTNWVKDAATYGFVASLVDGGVIENLNLELDVNFADPGNQYTYFGGIVGFLDGGTIRNCTVTGKIEGYNRIGGVVGYAKSGTIDKVTVKLTSIIAKAYSNNDAYTSLGGIIAYASAGSVTISNCTVSASMTLTNKSESMKGKFIGQADHWKTENHEWSATGANTLITIDKCKLGTTEIESVDVSGEKKLTAGIVGAFYNGYCYGTNGEKGGKLYVGTALITDVNYIATP